MLLHRIIIETPCSFLIANSEEAHRDPILEVRLLDLKANIQGMDGVDHSANTKMQVLT